MCIAHKMSMSAGEVQGCVTRLMVPTVYEIFVPLEEEHLWASSRQHDSLVVVPNWHKSVTFRYIVHCFQPLIYLVDFIVLFRKQ